MYKTTITTQLTRKYGMYEKLITFAKKCKLNNVKKSTAKKK